MQSPSHVSQRPKIRGKLAYLHIQILPRDPKGNTNPTMIVTKQKGFQSPALRTFKILFPTFTLVTPFHGSINDPPVVTLVDMFWPPQPVNYRP